MTSFTAVRCQPIKPGDTELFLILPVGSLPITGAFTTLHEVGDTFEIDTDGFTVNANDDVNLNAGGSVTIASAPAGGGTVRLHALAASQAIADHSITNAVAGTGGFYTTTLADNGFWAVSTSFGNIFLTADEATIRLATRIGDIDLLTGNGSFGIGDINLSTIGPFGGVIKLVAATDVLVQGETLRPQTGNVNGNILTRVGGVWVGATPAGPSGAAGGALAGTYPNPTLAAVVVGAGPLGDATHVVRLTFNNAGQITAATTVAISGAGIDTSAIHSGDAAGGGLAGTYPNPTLASVITAAGPIGDATHVPVITFNAKGQLTVVTSSAISGAGIDTSAIHSGDAAGGGLAGTYPNPTLASVIAAAGPIGDATHVAVVTFNAKGQLTAVTSQAISGAGIDTTAIHSGDAAGGALAGTYPNPTLASVPSAPTGFISPAALRLAPTGWLLCDGSAVSRTTFAALFAAIVTSATCTITIATPAVITQAAHGFVAGDPVVFTTTGALPTGLVVGTTYYVGAVGITTNTFRVRATPTGADIATSGTQSGTQTCTFAPYGLGDLTTTFNVPNLNGALPMGASATLPQGSAGGALTHTHGIGSVTLNAHTHDLANHTHDHNHTHDLQNHTHDLGNHTHTLSGHTHSTPALAYGGLGIGADNAGTGYAKMRLVGGGSSIQSRQITVAGYTDTIKVTTAATAADSTAGITVGIDLGGLTGSGIIAAANTGAPSTANTSTPSTNTSGAPSNNTSTAPSSNTTTTPSTNTSGTPSTAGVGGTLDNATGPIDPYTTVRYMIKT